MGLKEDDDLSKTVAKRPELRVALADIEAAVSAEYFLNAYEAVAAAGMPASEELMPLTICILVMRNGFSVIGKAAPVSPLNYNADVGRKFAREDAMRQLWPLMGFSLRDRIAASADVGETNY